MSRDDREPQEPVSFKVPQPRTDPQSRRRTAEVVPRGSTRWLLLHLLREARDPDWSPLSAARRLVIFADSDLRLLRAARVRLVKVTPADGRLGGSQGRALATLNIAIAELSEREQRHVGPGAGAGG